MKPDPSHARERLAAARVLLLFTPESCAGREPLAILDAVLDWIDVVQVRPKAPGSRVPCDARAAHDWTVRVLDLVHARKDVDVLVTVDDRVDVARLLWPRGCAGVHVGADDLPPAEARAFLGGDPLIGLSTHSFEDVLASEDEAVDYLGFGPVYPTRTKGYERGLGSEAAWIASQASARPLFPIGGISLDNAHELTRIGRAAVASSILAAVDPSLAASELRAQLYLAPPQANAP